jgi:hypothetical protein
MVQSLVTLALVGLTTAASAQSGPARIARCLHGDDESARDKTRREQAIKVAQAINTAEVVVVGPRTPKYRRPEELPHIPRLPQGFTLQFNTDGSSYSFSIKDALDGCHYAIFSDQEKFVYDGTPLTAPRVLPLTTTR